MSPVLRRMARDSRLKIQVAYCSLHGAEPAMDPGFGREVEWDVPLLDDYPWTHIPNRAIRPRTGKFFGLINPGLWKTVRHGKYDAIAVFTGYMSLSFWIALAASKASRTPILFGTDAHDLGSREHHRWKLHVKKWLWPRLFKLADVVIVPSSGGVNLMSSLGIAAERIVLTPYSVDNDWWIHHSKKTNRGATRAEWRVPENAPVVLFCAKLQPWKRPQDVLRAIARASLSDAYLVFAGDGPLRMDLEAEALSIGISERVRFIGFVNQSGLPAVYTAADLLVLPSQHEPFGVVVNEAMLCGCVVAVSDRVGARFDLVRHGETGFVFPVGDIDALSRTLQDAFEDRRQLQRIRELARERMSAWSPERNVDQLVFAIDRAAAFRVARDNHPTA
jgi:glycosyltransferase involved in cell wall biosynthesis